MAEDVAYKFVTSKGGLEGGGGEGDGGDLDSLSYRQNSTSSTDRPSICIQFTVSGILTTQFYFCKVSK